MIQIQDGDASVLIDPDFGNNTRSFRVRAHEFIWTPQPWTAPALAGIPLLAPWANRIDGESYLANGNRYLLNPELGNLRFDTNHLPIHGLLAFVKGWKIVSQDAASVSCRLEFWRSPRWMAQFPFAHTIEMTHRLRGSSLEIETVIENLCDEPMPVCIGYHPYFQLTDSPRDAWKVRIAASQQVGLSEKLIPTADRRTVDPNGAVALAGISLDSVFTSLTGENFTMEGAAQRISVRFGPKFPVAIVYAPDPRPFVCIEPMTALTNAFNDPNGGVPHIAPGDAWRESFWISVDC